MVQLLIFLCAFGFVFSDPIPNDNQSNDVYSVMRSDKGTFCTEDLAKSWSYEFHSCFMDKKYTDGGKNLNNIVDRILIHSKDCVANSTKSCIPDRKGFLIIMEKIIHQMKDYCNIYLEHIIHERSKIKDLECVETSLSLDTYKKCFKQDYSPVKLQREIENVISCTNQDQTKCSKLAKTSLNRMVRSILKMKQPEKENIPDDPVPEQPKKWYDYIFQPFISFWNTLKSWFGF